jgi:serine/threonine-protein kinase
MAGLAVYQWYELFLVLDGGTPACAINATVNCAAVWSSPLAQDLHRVTGMPVAGLGLVWGLTATGLAALIAARVRSGRDITAVAAALKVVAAVGVLSCVTFLTSTLVQGVVCLTCLATYVLVAVFAAIVFTQLPKPVWPELPALKSGGLLAGGVAAVCFVAMLYPGQKTKTEPTVLKPAGGQKVDEQALIKSFDEMPEREAKMSSLARIAYMRGEPKDTSNFPIRARWGAADAPNKLVDFTDILCPHCLGFERLTAQLRDVAPAGSLSLEARYFPLDGECNPQIPKSPGDGVRCTGAKVQLCLEQSPSYWDVRSALFENQQTLTREKIIEIAVERGTMSRDALMACVESPETQKRLNDDIIYAMTYNIAGTPLVLLNGREIPPVPGFILGMAVARGDVNAPLFKHLPEPPPQALGP